MSRANVPFKIIWFGDHAVRHGHPALAMAINKGISVTFKRSKGKNRIESTFDGARKVAKDVRLDDERSYILARNALKLKKFDEVNKTWYRPLQCLTSKFEYDNEKFMGNTFDIKIETFGKLARIPKGCGAGSAIGAALSASMYKFFYGNIRSKYFY